MKFGVFYEHQIPRPWDDGKEHRQYREALEQIELADELGYDYVWEVEHHFLEEYSHSSAPEVFLAAAAQRTEDIRLGHGIKLMPPAYNPPPRAAEQVATLDLVSDGRVEWGTGESSTDVELSGFDVDPDEKEAMWREATEQAANMMAMDPYPGYEGEYFEMPGRNVVPKPVQEPHPPLWVACSSRETIETAAKAGVGALCFAFASADQADEWVEFYYETFKEECVPIGRDVNPNVAMVTGFSCHEDWATAIQRGREGFRFFQYALAHYAAPEFGTHVPGFENIWEDFQRQGGADNDLLPEDADADTAIGTPDQIREHLYGFQDAGVDQVIFLQQGGNTRHEHICESLELFAEEAMPEFHELEAEREREKREDLEPYVEEAFERKEAMEPAEKGDLPEVEGLHGVQDLEEEAVETPDEIPAGED